MSGVLTTMVPRIWQQGLKRTVADVGPRNKGSIVVLNRFGLRETREQSTYARDRCWDRFGGTTRGNGLTQSKAFHARFDRLTYQ